MGIQPGAKCLHKVAYGYPSIRPQVDLWDEDLQVVSQYFRHRHAERLQIPELLLNLAHGTTHASDLVLIEDSSHQRSRVSASVSKATGVLKPRSSLTRMPVCS